MAQRGSYRTRFDGLLWASLGYLLLPYLIFVLGWLQWWTSIAVFASLAAAIVGLIRQPQPAAPTLDRKYLGWLGRLALVLVALSGVGELTWQHLDYFKHNLIWLELARQPWPLRYQDAELGAVFLDYYLAYYLPVGLLAKWLGTGVIPVASYLWTALGVWLGLLWLLRLCPRGWGYWLVSGLLVGWPGTLWGLIELHDYAPYVDEWVRKSVQPGILAMFMGKASLCFFSSFETLSLSAQHFLPTWLGSLLLINAWQRQRWGYLGLLIGSLAFWSLFAAMGVGLVALGRWLYDPKRGVWQSSNLLAVLATWGVLLPYYAAHFPIEQSGWLWDEMPTPWHSLVLLAFLLVSVLPTWRLVVWGQKRFRHQSEVIRLSHIALLLVLLAMSYWMGQFNDSFVRIAGVFSILVHLSMGEIWRITQAIGRPWERRMLWGVMLGLMFNPLLQMSLQFTPHYTIWPAYYVPPTNSGQYPSLSEINRLHEGVLDFDLKPQYLGRAESLFGRYLMRPTE